MARYIGPLQKKLRHLGLESYGVYSTRKDKRGNPTTFTLKIAFKIEIENSLGEKKVTVFEEYTSYENNDNKFELKKYENSIKKNMIESINESLILYLQNLNY